MVSISESFKTRPLIYYGLSIAASWAGVGSLLNTITITKTLGIVPALIWTAANVFACVLFGIVINRLPTLREVIRTKFFYSIISLMAVFQIWYNMNGIREVFSDTSLGVMGGTALAYATAVFFVVLLLWRGMIRNILTDGASWLAVYGLIAFITVAAFIQNGGEIVPRPLGLEAQALTTGLHKALNKMAGLQINLGRMLQAEGAKALKEKDLSEEPVAVILKAIELGIQIERSARNIEKKTI